ncbi:hypothetical protein V3F56_04465 [Moorellaceae bacterium AZ2]
MKHFRMGTWAWVLAIILTFVFTSGIAWASGLPPSLLPISPAMTLSGDEIRIGDPSAPNAPVSVLSSEQKKISQTDLGDVVVLKGYGASDIRPVKENHEQSGVKIQYREAKLIEDF